MYGGNGQNSGYWWFEVVGLNYRRKEYMRDFVEQFRGGENATRGVIYIYTKTHTNICIYRLSQEEYAKLQESFPYVKV